MDLFQLAAGSVMGADHARISRPNQDAYKVVNTPNLIAAVVCDGCGDLNCAHSEFGSRFGAEFIASALIHGYIGAENHAELLTSVHSAVLTEISQTSKCLGSYSLDSTCRDFFLFTTVGCLIDQHIATFFGMGDGTLYINGEKLGGLGPFPDNAPPYLTYGLWPSPPQECLAFTIHRQIPTSELYSFLIGSDGVSDIEASEGFKVPNQRSEVGPISQFWTDELYFLNNERVNQRLRLMNTEHTSVDWAAKRLDKHHALLMDDTTLVSGRRNGDADRLSGG